MWFDYYKWQESMDFIGRCENCGSYFQPKRNQRIKNKRKMGRNKKKR